MDEENRQNIAEERAHRYAPAPSGRSAMAGLCVAVVAVGGDFIISGFYGLRPLEHWPLILILGVAGFLVGLLGHKRLARANRKAARAERRGVDAEQDDLR
ncbi:hypothetical protein [Brevundimonas sp. GCM10030266]|uniref:hypothetical protein n=1 Tax=Brevundimonas sp. GCM10030266 TaxID=3273386 RepID=UPI003608AB87